MSAMMAPSRISRDPDGGRGADAVLGLDQERVQAADGKRAEHRPPQARHASDDEHRERHEGELEVDLLGRDRAEQVDEQPAREAGERARRP